MSLTKVSYSMINGASLNVLDFGADPTGATDSTAAIQAAINQAGTSNGGLIYVPEGTYLISNLEVMYPNVYLQGNVSQYSYNTSYQKTTRFKVAPTADWGVLFGAQGDYNTNWGNASGMSNIVLDGEDAVEFGLAICVGFTVVTDVTVTGFEYGFVGASFLNSNIFDRCNFFKNSKIGFAMVDRFGAGTALEAANTAMYNPGNPTPFFNGYNTVITVRNCNMRENGGYGIVIINALGTEFTNCIVESNYRAGLWVYREQLGSGTDNKYNRNVTFNKVWFENNWVNYVPGNAYSNVGWRYVDYTPDSIYNPITDAGNGIFVAGYDAGTYPEGYEFNYCSLTSLAGVLLAKRSKYFKFYQCVLVGSTVPVTNVTLSADAINFTFERCEYDPYAPNAIAQKAHILTQGTGTWLIENEKVNTAAGLLSDYEEGTWSATLFGATTTGSYGFRVNDGRYTKIGRQVTVSFYTDQQLVITVGSGNLTIGGLPFQYPASPSFGGPAGISYAGVINACYAKNLVFTGSQLMVSRNTLLAGTTLNLTGMDNTGATTAVPITAITSNQVIAFSITYTI